MQLGGFLGGLDGFIGPVVDVFRDVCRGQYMSFKVFDV